MDELLPCLEHLTDRGLQGYCSPKKKHRWRFNMNETLQSFITVALPIGGMLSYVKSRNY